MLAHLVVLVNVKGGLSLCKSVPYQSDDCPIRTINGRDFVPSRKHSQEHFSTDSTARKRNLSRDVLTFV